jgi:hypothetical protein
MEIYSVARPIRWIKPTCKRTRHLPVWKRSLALTADGTLFMAAAMGGSEKEVSFASLHEKVPSLICFDHVYVPADWLQQSFGAANPWCDSLIKAAHPHVLDQEG